MMRKIIFLLLLLFAIVITAHPTDILDGSGSSATEFDITLNDDLLEDEIQIAQRQEALAKLQQIFGIPETSARPSPHKIAPQFMMELYNTIADPNGVTRGKNPYNAKIVRSFIEKDSFTSHHYMFNITGLEMNESILEAELHLYRKRTPLKAMHRAVLSSPYFLIRVYQVLDENQLDIPDLHRLLNVHYVGAHDSGWQVFNVKQAVLSWISGAPNLGLLVTASNLFGDDVAVHFSRKNDYRHSKQPILVLFDDDGKDSPVGENIIPHYYKYANDLEDHDEDEAVEYNENKAESGEDESFENDEFEREKGREEAAEFEEHSTRTGMRNAKEEEAEIRSSRRRERREASPQKKSRRIVSKQSNIGEALTSMDIYERAEMRKKLARNKKTVESELRTPDSSISNSKKRRSRSTVEPSASKSNTPKQINDTKCTRHELYVDFKEIGWSDFIIAPKSYSAYHCKGHCGFPLSQGQHPTNHATVQTLIHILRLGEHVDEPCCVPDKLRSITLLYLLDDYNVILKLYQDMVVDRCGCH